MREIYQPSFMEWQLTPQTAAFKVSASLTLIAVDVLLDSNTFSLLIKKKDNDNSNLAGRI